jgi:hypothetical protein
MKEEIKMTKEKLFELLDKAIDNISDSYFCDEEREMLTYQLKDAKLPFSYSVESGISKAVILIKDFSYVIKIPFNSIYNEDAYCDAHYDWEEEYDNIKANSANLPLEEVERLLLEHSRREPEGGEDQFYYPLEGATHCALDSLENAPDWDYCNLECAIYEEAVKQGLGAYFAEEGWLGNLSCNHPVYYQQRCTPLCSLELDYCGEEYEIKSKRARTTCEKYNMDCFNPYWINDFIDIYGEDELRRLNEFIKEMDIGDLRDCNIGYLDNAPILFDYSGFRYWD